MGKFIDLTGEKFGRLLVLCFTPRRAWRGGKSKWFCLCDCGRTRIVFGWDLKSGATRSCRCLSVELSKARSTTHGASGSKIYGLLEDMKSRCYNNEVECYKNYGGRGITVCEEWLVSSEKFLSWAKENGYQQDLQIDRINNNGNYTPENCRFVTQYVNSHNKRRLRANNKSGYAGVGSSKSGNFTASIGSKYFSPRKVIHLGTFSTLEAAAMARNEFIRENNLPHRIQGK